MSIYFLRHAKTFNNMNHILSGQSETNIVPNQTIFFEDTSICFDVIYSSTAKRCIDTLQLLPACYFSANIIYTDVLLERSIGILENTTRDEAQKKFPELFINGKINIDCIIPNGETINDVVCRISLLTNNILATNDKHNCLICSHNQTLKIMYALIKNIPITNEYWYNKNFKPGEITKIL